MLKALATMAAGAGNDVIARSQRSVYVRVLARLGAAAKSPPDLFTTRAGGRRSPR
jgi:hypothetical protein